MEWVCPHFFNAILLKRNNTCDLLFAFLDEESLGNGVSSLLKNEFALRADFEKGSKWQTL